MSRSAPDCSNAAANQAGPHGRGEIAPTAASTQRKRVFEAQDRGEYTQAEIAELFSASRAAVYRELKRRREAFLASCEAHIF